MNFKVLKSFVVTVLVVVIAMLAYLGGTASRIFMSFSRGPATALAAEEGTAKVIFAVKCYDDGKAVLQGLKGVQKIVTGFHYINETDTVYYDPKVITVEDMEIALRKAGTYVKTVK